MTKFLVTNLLTLVVVTSASQDLLTDSFNHCINANSWSPCLKQELLIYLDKKLGTFTEARSLDSVDEAIVARTVKYLKNFEYEFNLPFVDACLKYRPSRSLADLDLEFKNNELATKQARGFLKKKLMLPLLLLLKLKLKALMPIFVAIIGIKAMKALIISKLALIIVIAFVALQFLKKGGMAPAMGMSMSMEPAPVYGAPPLPSTTSSYDPANTWDGNGPYSRVWTPSNGVEGQNLAYNYYSSGGSSSSYGSPSSSSSSSGSSSSSSSYS